jgi:hypothetical protein
MKIRVGFGVGFEVLIAVVMKSIVFCDSRLLCFHTPIMLVLFFNPENGGDMFLRNVD